MIIYSLFVEDPEAIYPELVGSFSDKKIAKHWGGIIVLFNNKGRAGKKWHYWIEISFLDGTPDKRLWKS